MTESEGLVQGRRRDVLLTIAEFENRGELVTTARIAERLELPRQNIRGYLLALRDLGLIHYEPSERFTTPLRLTETGWQQPGLTRALPRELRFPILGEVAAGQPTLADSRIEGYAARLSDILDLHEGDFLLRVRGESMTGIGIYPGDLVAIHPSREEPHGGEIALVVVPGEDTATLKRWRRNNGTVTLLSENPAHAPMTYPVEEVEVQGCLVGHIGTGRTRRSPNGEG